MLMMFIGIMLAVGVAHWLVYTALLWIMIKIQKLNYNLPGLLGSSLLATALDQIPVVGIYLGFAVLVFCIWKCTGAEISPDVLFTVGVAGALMFCVNLFLLGSLMGDLRGSPALADGDFADEVDGIKMETELEEEFAGETVVTIPATNWMQTNRVQSVPVKITAVTSTPAPMRDANTLPVQLTVKGISMNGAQRSAMIADGHGIRDIRLGDSFAINSDKGRMVLVCEEITGSSVILAAEGTRVKLSLY